MLRESWLNALAVASAFAGITVLLFYSYLDAPQNVSINEINESFSEKLVAINAKVDSAYVRGNAIFAQLFDGNRIKAVAFYPNEEEKKLLKKNNFVSVEGKIRIEKGETELLIEEVKEWR